MRVIVEFDPTKAVVNVMGPTATTEGEPPTQLMVMPTVQEAALYAGAYAGIDPEQREGAVQATIERVALEAGAFAGIAPEQGHFAVRPQSTDVSGADATESTPTPIIVDRL